MEDPRKRPDARRRWLPLLLMLAAVAVFDLIAMTSLTSLESHVFTPVLGIGYTQSLLSAIWLANGLGKFAARAIIAFGLLLAAAATIFFYIANAIGPSILDWIAPIAVVFILGLLVHWALCVMAMVVGRSLRWRIDSIESDSGLSSDLQFGIRTILLWTAITAVAITAVPIVLGASDWDISRMDWHDTYLALTYSSFCALLQLLVVIGILAARKLPRTLAVVALSAILLTWLEIETIRRLFGDVEFSDFIYFNSCLFAGAAALAITARLAGLRFARKAKRPD